VTRLIINADDFGLNGDVNRGIIMAREAGAITNTTLMIKKEGASEAIDYALANPSFSVGLHIDIDEIVLGERKGSKRFEETYLTQRLADPQILDAIEEDLLAQLELFEKSGLPLSHIDSHHHLHALPQLFYVILKVLEGRRIRTMRVAKNYDLVKYPSIMWDPTFYDRAIIALNKQGISIADRFLPFSEIDLLEAMPQGITEMMTHVGKGESWREKELRFLMSDKWQALLKQNNVELISFRDIAKVIPDERN